MAKIGYEIQILFPVFLSAACDCNEAGSSSNNCDSASGQCPCKENIAGDKCDQPAPGYYDFPEPQGNFSKLFYYL